MGNKYYILIIGLGHNLEYPHCLQQKMPMEYICDYKWSKNLLACVKSTKMHATQSSSLVAKFWVLILTPIDEDDVPPNGGLHGLTQTKCTSSSFA